MTFAVTMDEAIAAFKRKFPNWYWSITECWVSIHGHCSPDWTPGHQDHPDRGIKSVKLEIGNRAVGRKGHDPTPASFLVEKARAARAAHCERDPESPEAARDRRKKDHQIFQSLQRDYDRRGKLIEELQARIEEISNR